MVELVPGINSDNYTDIAEKVMKDMGENKPTTSQIRNILSLISQIYNDAVLADESLTDEMISKIKYLKVRIVYEAGRDSDRRKNLPVKTFVQNAKLTEILESISKDKSKKKFVLFSRYVEALVAYHKYLGGRD